MTTTTLPDQDELSTIRDNFSLSDASVDRLFQDSEIEAEYAIGWMRIAAGFVLFASGLGVSSGIAALTEGQILHQLMFTCLRCR